MKNFVRQSAFMALLLLCLQVFDVNLAEAESAKAPLYSSEGNKVSQATVRSLVEPIALYPDRLLQQILPASTFPDQITDAALLIQSKADAELIQDQKWDNSVKIVATYPGVLKMMYSKLDWTTALGNAFLNQHEDVLDQIQELRKGAKRNGNLDSTSQQTVATKKDDGGNTYITIESPNPEVVYVPQQTSSVVYTEPVSDSSSALVPLATFGLGLALGSALDDDDDDHYYYGGPWGGPMWSSNSSFDNWVDMRHDYYEDRHDRVMDRQDFRQDQRGDRQDFRQDWAKDNPDKINQANLNQARSNAQNKLSASSGTRQQQLSNARTSMESRGFGGSNYSRSGSFNSGSRTYGGNSWSGSGGSRFAQSSSNRGSYSRSMSGGSSFSGGGFSRGGGGGGFRGGGGRGGRR